MPNKLLLISLWAMASQGIAAPTSVADIQRPSIGQCIAGNCTNGYGTLAYPDGSAITGNLVNGNTVAGSYDIRYSCRPDKIFSLILDEQKFNVSGSTVRCPGALGLLESGNRPTYFTGTFSTITNPFTQEKISVYKTGVYTDGDGIKWEGEFDYIPVRNIVKGTQWGDVSTRKGSFIFMGAKIDDELDEVVNGLYISEPVSPGSEIVFIKARPDYLAKLRSTFVAEQMKDDAEREADARASSELFKNIAFFASTALVAYSNYKAGEISANRSTMDSLSRVMRGQKSPMAANADLPHFGKATSPARPISVAEYKNQQKDAASNVMNGNSPKTATQRQQVSQARVPALPAGRMQKSLTQVPPVATSASNRQASPDTGAIANGKNTNTNWTPATESTFLWSQAWDYCAARGNGSRLPTLEEIRNLYLAGGTKGWVKGDTWTSDHLPGSDGTTHLAYDTNGNGFGDGYENAQYFENSRFHAACIH